MSDAADIDRMLHRSAAMTLYNLRRHHEAMQLLLEVIADTTGDAELRRYDRALRFYAPDLDRRWQEER